jgi:hypothetical protein
LDLIGFWTAERDESAGTECVDLIDSVMAEPPFGQTGAAIIPDCRQAQVSLTRPPRRCRKLLLDCITWQPGSAAHSVDLMTGCA